MVGTIPPEGAFGVNPISIQRRSAIASTIAVAIPPPTSAPVVGNFSHRDVFDLASAATEALHNLSKVIFQAKLANPLI